MRAALGFKIHTGWAIMVALAGQPEHVNVLLRRRVELVPRDDSIPRFAYHQAAELPLLRAAALIKRVESASQHAAKLALQDVLNDLTRTKVGVCGVISGSTPVPDNLPQILGSHPLIHAAEGALFLHAIVSACENLGIKVASAAEREVWPGAAAAWRVSEAGLRKQMDELRQSLGAPWSADHKSAAAMALLALKT